MTTQHSVAAIRAFHEKVKAECEYCDIAAMPGEIMVGAMLQHYDALSQSLAERTREQSGWLLEAAESPVSKPLYWCGSFGDERDLWTEDHMHAVRLCRRQDAEMVASHVLNGYAVRIAEHSWS